MQHKGFIRGFHWHRTGSSASQLERAHYVSRVCTALTLPSPRCMRCIQGAHTCTLCTVLCTCVVPFALIVRGALPVQGMCRFTDHCTFLQARHAHGLSLYISIQGAHTCTLCTVLCTCVVPFALIVDSLYMCICPCAHLLLMPYCISLPVATCYTSIAVFRCLGLHAASTLFCARTPLLSIIRALHSLCATHICQPQS
jgi:hypothetical protein